ncbi:zinc ribbon domain-containing protein [Edaphobacter sp. 12200R-103]|jgi:prepilin signal peptidase PulO-like enzyme (type II secretory pathway)|uniref:zinc ribbon domain-containing protein n=1 Tax=Edaphobacter sp. 12200R-103 TaxID=2703788 RepID=UPI00138BE726|nr:zinc ribbon domain-containing protein [Edaphobacter sp. 12200R-103]QHS53055.1 zinc ribbon domain-containing protein [Edaphobacter sp. 12200R-103]
MQAYCHRCEEPLLSGDESPAFCPHCGAPQIYLSDALETASAAGEASTGVLPPPHPQQIDWKAAILCAMMVALVAAVLSVASTRLPAFSFINWLWTISASVVALTLYQRRRPQALMDAMVGAKIGVLVGLTLIASIGVAMAIAGLVARFGLHNMATFDGELRAQIEKAAAANPQPANLMRFIYSPEFKAGIMLAGFSMLAGLVVLMSTVGGAVSGLLRTRRQ